MLILLEGRIGHEDYTSVSGSVNALSQLEVAPGIRTAR
jgi:hypothetical protein